MVTILIPVWIGQQYGHYAKKKSIDIVDAPIGSAVGATLGLLAFMLGIIFQVVGGRFEKRQDLVIAEISSLRSTYMYAGLIPEPMRSISRKLVVEYVDVGVDLRQQKVSFSGAMDKSKMVLDTLWHFAEILAAQDRSSEAYSLYTASVAELNNVYSERKMVVFQTRIPVGIFYVLGLVGFFSMFILGYQFGISGKTGFALTIVLSFTFAAVMWLIFALDRPETGFIKVTQEPLLTFQKELHAASK